MNIPEVGMNGYRWIGMGEHPNAPVDIAGDRLMLERLPTAR